MCGNCWALVMSHRVSMARRRPRTYCPGSSKAVIELRLVEGALWDTSCSRCHRSVRATKDGTAYKHFAKAPVDRTDPNHSKRVQETYGITGSEYEAILKAQDGKCAICQQPPRSKRLAVDHDHTLGNTREAVRGLLCRRCNHRLLGSAHDATEILHRAIEYLTHPPAKTILKVED